MPLGFVLVRRPARAGLVLIALFAVFGASSSGAEDAMVADLVPPEGREAGYAGVRVAKNLGVSFGPVLGGLLLLGEDWSRLFRGVFVRRGRRVGGRLPVPAVGRQVRAGRAARARARSRVVRRDHAFLLFVGAMALASMTYVAFDSLLAISLVDSHGFSPATWGFIVVINPILVTLVQLRLTRAVAGVPRR